MKTDSPAFTWFRASAELNGGDRVRFATTYGAAGDEIPAGTLATVVENSLNEMQPVLIVRLDDAKLRDSESDKNIWLPAPDDDAIDENGEPIKDSRWQRACIVERIAH